MGSPSVGEVMGALAANLSLIVESYNMSFILSKSNRFNQGSTLVPSSCHNRPSMSFSHMCLSPGAIKLSLPSSAFLHCAQSPPPSNTMFRDVNPVRVGMPTMEAYLPLVLRLFELSPEGILSPNNKIIPGTLWSSNITMDKWIMDLIAKTKMQLDIIPSFKLATI